MDAGGEGQAGKKKKRILKRIIRTKKPDGSYTSKEILITDPKEVKTFILINISTSYNQLHSSMTRELCVFVLLLYSFNVFLFS